MATTKTVEEQGPYLNTDLQEELVSYILPREMVGSDQTAFVSVNGRVYNLPRGRQVSIPRCVAEHLDMLRKAKDAYEMKVAQTYDDEKVKALDGM